MLGVVRVLNATKFYLRKAAMQCPQCKQEKGDLAEDEICVDCLFEKLNLPYEQEEIICSDSAAEYEESTDILPEPEE